MQSTHIHSIVILLSFLSFYGGIEGATAALAKISKISNSFFAQRHDKILSTIFQQKTCQSNENKRVEIIFK